MIGNAQSLNFPTLCFSTGQGLPENSQGHGQMPDIIAASILKALCVLAAPQCPAEIEREVKSSWQDLSLGTDKQQERISGYVVRTMP